MKKLLVAIASAFCLAACLDLLPPVVTLDEVKLPMVEGDATWNATDYEGKPVFVVFMGSWCPHCQRNMPAVSAVAEEFGDRVEIVGVFMDDDPEDVKAVAKEHGLTVRALYNGSEVAESFGVKGIPHAIVFDKKHRLVKRWEGEGPTMEQEYKEALRKVVK